MRKVKEIKKDLKKLHKRCGKLEKERLCAIRQRKRTKGKTFSEYMKKFHWFIRIDQLNEDKDFAMGFGIKDKDSKLFSIILGEQKNYTEFLFNLNNPDDKDLLTRLVTFLESRICPETRNIFVSNKNNCSVPVLELGVSIEDWWKYTSEEKEELLDGLAIEWPTDTPYYRHLYEAETQDDVFRLIQDHHNRLMVSPEVLEKDTYTIISNGSKLTVAAGVVAGNKDDMVKTTQGLMSFKNVLVGDIIVCDDEGKVVVEGKSFNSNIAAKEESLIFDMIGSPTINIEFVANDILKFSSTDPDGKEKVITLKDYQVEKLRDFLNNH